ncbi:hypothetical protein ACCO45_013258 [Purpureocillium lilacinum]|uniref:Uncharacterized protein n=1 Tax=Purpureocillium lilacinum TaxID=33203 RepID=A0ACC4DDD2_PURLI
MLRLSRGLADDRSERGFVDGRRPFVAASQPPALPRDTAAAALRCMPESSWGGGGERWELGVQVPGRMREPPPWPLGGILRQKTPPNRSPWHFFSSPTRLAPRLGRRPAGRWERLSSCACGAAKRACVPLEKALSPAAVAADKPPRLIGPRDRIANCAGRQSGPARDRWTGIVRQREHGARAHEGIARGHRDMRTVPPHGRALDGGTLPQCGHRRGVRGGTAESIGGVASEPPPVRASARPQATHPVASSTTTTSRARCICRTLTLSGDQSQREA